MIRDFSPGSGDRVRNGQGRLDDTQTQAKKIWANAENECQILSVAQLKEEIINARAGLNVEDFTVLANLRSDKLP